MRSASTGGIDLRKLLSGGPDVIPKVDWIPLAERRRLESMVTKLRGIHLSGLG